MRPLALALLALVLSASPARAAVIEIEVHTCDECDSGSGTAEDTVGLVVRAAPGEQNAITIRRSARGIVINDAGAPLTGRCRPATSGGRFCRGDFDGADVFLGDRDDTLESVLSGSIDGGSGDDEVRGTGEFYALAGGPGADTLDATASYGATVSYADHTEGVTVTLNGLPDDGAPGEGDNVLGPVTGMTGGAGDDRLEAGPTSSGLFGGGGDDTLVGSPERDTIDGGGGDDELLGGGGTDYLTGDAGADVLSGGEGWDEVGYGGTAPLRLSIGDGPNDGAEGEGDDIRDDVESLTGGRGDDLLIGDDDANRLIAYGGRDVLRGGAGPDQLIGWGDGDELDAGPGRDLVEAGSFDRPLLADGEADRLNCRSHAPVIEADALDQLRSCAPRVTLRPRRRVRPGRRLPLTARCPADSRIDCEGYVVLHLRRGRRVSRRVRLGPIEPGSRAVVGPRLRAGIRPGTCIYATAVTVRGDRPEASTATRSPIGCLPR